MKVYRILKSMPYDEDKSKIGKDDDEQYTQTTFDGLKLHFPGLVFVNPPPLSFCNTALQVFTGLHTTSVSSRR